MRKAVWLCAGLVVCALGADRLGDGAAAQQAPASTTVDPHVAPDGGEPGIVAGPPNPGYCAKGAPGEVHATVHAVAPAKPAPGLPPC